MNPDLVASYYEALSDSYYCVLLRPDGKYTIGKLQNKEWKALRRKAVGGPLVCPPESTAVGAERVLKTYIFELGFGAEKYNYVWSFFPTPESVATPLKPIQYRGKGRAR